MTNNKTKKLIIELSDFRDKIGLHLEKDNSNRIGVVHDDGDSYSISQKELEAIREIMDKKPELQELAPGLYAACFIFISLFENEWA